VPIDWLKAVFDQGGLDHIDAVSVHPYSYPAAPDQLAAQIQAVGALIGTYGVTRDIWISELGWTSATTQLSVDPRTQASYAVRGAATAYAAVVRDFFWYDFMNDGTDAGEQEQNFGRVQMVSGGSTRPKPAYVAYANLARQLQGAATPAGPKGLVQDSPATGVSRVVVPGGSTTTWMLWAATSTPFAVRTARSATFTDTYGGTNELAGTTPTGVSSDGTVQITGYTGAQDLSFDFWLSHDADRFYLTVAVTDDVLYGQAIGDQIWQDDSVQFAVGAGTPGEAQTWSEIGAALVGGAVSTWRWSGPATGSLPAGDTAITRSGTTTTYELGVAWTDLGIDPSDGLISFSMLVNDNDGQGRKGYLEWASGIGGSKDSSLFKAFVLDA
jgi:cellulose/xylan binding protein with CBM9 domain